MDPRVLYWRTDAIFRRFLILPRSVLHRVLYQTDWVMPYSALHLTVAPLISFCQRPSSACFLTIPHYFLLSSIFERTGQAALGVAPTIVRELCCFNVGLFSSLSWPSINANNLVLPVLSSLVQSFYIYYRHLSRAIYRNSKKKKKNLH